MTRTSQTSVPRVSVILPFYNEARFLAGAVATVRDQTVADWELLLVDDGSSDSSAGLADEFAADDPRITVVRHEGGVNRGLVASRNLGIERARADAIAFIDADDRWESSKLAIQLEVLDHEPDVGMTCSPVWFRTIDGTRADVLMNVGAINGRSGGRDRFDAGELCRALVRRTVEPPPPSNVMYRASALRGVGGVPAGDDLYEDQRAFFAVNLLHPVRVTPEPLSVYACRSDSLFGSLATRHDVKYFQREAFERWAMRWAAHRGGVGRRLAASTLARRTVARTRWRLRHRLGRAVRAERHPRIHRIVTRLRRGRVRYGSFRRLTPIARNWGYDRGQPVDRYYIERFLSRHRDIIRGRVLEVQSADYTVKFGVGVDETDVVDIDAENSDATIIADLQVAGSLPFERFDCAIVTQTLQYVDDVVPSIANLWQSLAPGGSLLVTFPTVSQVDEALPEADRWRLTPRGLMDVLRRACPDGEIEVEGYGNVLISTAFLYGLVADEFSREELDHYDPIFPTGALGRATKLLPTS